MEKKIFGKKCGDYVWSKGFISLEIRGKKYQGGCSKEYHQVCKIVTNSQKISCFFVISLNYFMFQIYIYFTKKFFTQLLKVSCTFQYNHQATGLKKYEITTIDLKTTNPYLPDRVEFKHQFVKFKAGHAIYIKKECFNPLHLVERGVCQV